MAFFKFRTRGPQANEGRNASVAAAPAESVEAMRRRARHRLVGAAVLVLVGVIGFPLLFDTQPRPISVDIPIEIPDRNKTKPLVLPSTPAPTSTTTTTPTTTPAASAGSNGPAIATAPSGSGMITEAPDGSEIAPSKPAPSAPRTDTRPAAPVAEAKPEPRPEPKPKPEHKPEAKPEARAEAKPEKPVPGKPADDGNRALALLEGKVAAATVAKPPAAAATATATAPSDEAGRFVVQVGAFADADKAREVRQKLEKAGLKTFTNVAKTSDGERTRVRVGPFGTRAEADKAAGRIKGLSLSAAVLSL